MGSSPNNLIIYPPLWLRGVGEVFDSIKQVSGIPDIEIQLETVFLA